MPLRTFQLIVVAGVGVATLNSDAQGYSRKLDYREARLECWIV